jgi:hypothetical protein
MEEVTVAIPGINTEAYFSFKEPFNTYIRSKFNLDPLADKLKVISIISMKDRIRNDLRDPFTDLYEPAGLTEVEYKQDLLDNISILTFSFRDRKDIERYVRCPINYIESYSDITQVEYINKLIVVDLNKLPKEYDVTAFFTDLSDFIETRTGVIPEIKEVNIGDVELLTEDEHATRETVRTNSITVYKTLEVQLSELQLAYDSIIARLTALGIVLGN